MYTYCEGRTRNKKKRQTGEQLDAHIYTHTHTHTHQWEGFLSDCVVWFALTATASQSLSALYWVRAITEDQVVNKLQAVHFWEGHAYTHTHTHMHTQICKYRCMHTSTQNGWKLFEYIHAHKLSHWLYCTFEMWAICGQILLQSPSVHIQMYQRHREGWKWGRTGVNLAEWRQPCRMILPSPKLLRLIKLICHQGNLSSLVIRNTLSPSLSVCFSLSGVILAIFLHLSWCLLPIFMSCSLMPFFTFFPWWLIHIPSLFSAVPCVLSLS